MCYDAEEKRRIDYVLAVFKRYIEASSRFDIVFSQKAGYIRISVSGESQTAQRISDTDCLVELILNEIVYDSVLSPKYSGFAPDCNDPLERAKHILYSYADEDEATLEKLCTALVFMLEPYNRIRNP